MPRREGISFPAGEVPLSAGPEDGLHDADEQLDTALAVLTDRSLANVVDLVAWARGRWLHVANADGSSRIPLDLLDGPWELISGHDPVANQDPLHGVPLPTLGEPSRSNAHNSYPFAARRLASAFFDPDRAPDIAVVHTPGHYWPERGGHLGEHGSLDAAQSRAPLLLAGPGVTARGVLRRTARIVDIAPTLAVLAGTAMHGVDGRALTEVVQPGARHLVGVLWDGANSNDLLELAAVGELPAVARLLDSGCAFAGGAIAEFPSVTLVNHTSALTGVGPGRHGIVHNVYWDRGTRRLVLANDSATWHHACDQLRPGVATVFEAIAADRPDRAIACVNEPIDRGASYSTFDLVRASGQERGAGGLGALLPSARDDPHASQEWVEVDPDYAWSTQVDGLALAQVRELWSSASGAPLLTWWNTTLTDTGHHAGGPYSPQARASLRDADRRLQVFLNLLDERGLSDDTIILLTADHGSEGADPSCRGDWDAPLKEAGIHFRDEGPGFLYLRDATPN